MATKTWAIFLVIFCTLLTASAQVLWKFGVNAIKFTDKGGMINVSANSDNENWSISIRDTGRGIARENIPKLFDKFFQVENYMTRDKGGTGLGLSIVHNLVTSALQGTIKAESEVGQGTRFVLRFPQAGR